MAGEGNAADSQRYPKTHAKELYCLTDKDLEPLPVKEKRNPYVRSGTPMKLYKQSELEEAAIQKWGSLEELEKEKQKRIARKEKKALEKATEGENEKGMDSEERVDTEEKQSPCHGQGAFDQQGRLHPLLQERVLKLRTKHTSSTASGKYVVYWMRTAVRDHDNPALDVAVAEAMARKLPLLCASFLLGKGAHTYPTHRRYKFLLEGLRDVQASLRAAGVLHLVYVEGVSGTREGSSAEPGWNAVMAVVKNADLVVTEIMPTPPYANWLEDLSKQAPAHTDIWAVDTACVVPVTIVNRAYAKAYAFRSNTAKMRSQRLSSLPYHGKSNLEGATLLAVEQAEQSIPWKSIDLTDGETDIPALLRQSDAFDDSVPGIDHMPGGQSAGYARWEAFRRSGLGQYAARRNNPMIRSGVSRLSAYHHFGMVSPFRIAKDATSASSMGARKFADEFMTWRELSYSFCHHSWNKIETMEILPAWAQKTLNAHKGDRRELKSLKQLEEGTTGDEIWDALQHQLNVTGELHNNVRMTWGKALLPWTSDPETALKYTIHLNHKYALDGMDPCSYGGILWCFGQFDGPKGSESTPVYGSLRHRPTHLLSRKLSAERFRSLQPDEAPEALAGAMSHSAGAGDIRTLFKKAEHQGEKASRDADGQGSSSKLGLTAQEPSTPTLGSPKKRKQLVAGQTGIARFFKTARTHK